jgi:hypothetical protein
VEGAGSPSDARQVVEVDGRNRQCAHQESRGEGEGRSHAAPSEVQRASWRDVPSRMEEKSFPVNIFRFGA